MESKIIELIEAQSRMVVARVWGVGGMGRYWSKGTRFQLCTMKKFWRSDYSLVIIVNNTVFCT